MTCKECGDDVEGVVSVKVERRTVRVCEDCADILRENEEISDQAERVVQSMMEYRDRR